MFVFGATQTAVMLSSFPLTLEESRVFLMFLVETAPRKPLSDCIFGAEPILTWIR